MSDVGLTHIALPVTDLDESADFYERYARMQIVHRREGVLWLSDKTRPFVLGDRPTIVDFSLAGYVYYPASETGFDIAAEYPAIDAWRNRLALMKGWKPPYEMMPVGSDLRVGRVFK